MARFNQRGTRPAVYSPVTTTGERTRTHEGATGYLRDARSELFLLSVSNFVGQDAFYEKGGDRDDRYTQLVRQLAVEDPAWTVGLLGWLRGEGNMRTAAIVGAAEFVKARLDATAVGDLVPDARAEGVNGGGWNRQVIDAVLQRPDEPGELLGYWTSRYGRKLPKPVKRGIADAVQRLYNGKSLLKYDTASKGYRFGDILNLVHAAPDPGKPWQGELFQYALDRRHHADAAVPPESNKTLTAHRELMALPVEQRRAVVTAADGAERLAAAGMTWEALAGWLQGPMDKAAWEAVIPSMGVMALARNLRNFDEAGVSDTVAAQICTRFADPKQVAKSRMFPFRWWAAYKHAPSLRWAHALEQALTHSLVNVPQLSGHTLILVDRSPSMFPGYGFSTPNTSDIPLAEQAAVFGSALAMRAQQPTLVEFGGSSKTIDVPRGGSVLRLIEKYSRNDGTDIPSAIKQHFDLLRHNRIVIVTDEQTRPGWLPSNMERYGGMRETAIDDLVPTTVPVYLWNLAGYKAGAMPSGTTGRHCFGGLTDQAFRMVPLLESGRDAAWPWETR
ncbi:TROVE domain-containing protein [Streptomyces sp. NBC_01239]|uniref:TROVE domain-containing protein n=1 Tax=Streptomyces sp. NBC_01239 TaxID=2903792 RepID=UPI002259970C|nr:TROVE domain-containing protein [Streptomyces sp. NBC_01239]MCX4816791.1 TROVE domain-containing protein [Streptomyces sp. NBC_01239]MCX4818239.1 TROVE domain-containing protein [Streptomyces sp. NBC_01239]